MRHMRVWWLIIAAIVAVDACSKYMVWLYLSPMQIWNATYPYGGIGLFANVFGISLSINYVSNTGGAWGMFSAYGGLLLLFRLCIVSVLLWYACQKNAAFMKHTGVCLVIAGALGNILDTAVYGHVIDMIKCVFWGYHYPVFNIADASICVGMGFLFLDLVYAKKTKRRRSSI